MKKLILLLGLLLGLPLSAQAQTQASVIPGYMSTSGCPSGLSVCFVAYGSSLPFTPGVNTATPTDRGGTITSGGTSQTLAASNTSRKLLLVENPCNATEDLFIATAGAATVNGAGNYADLGPCGSASLVVNGIVITGAVTVIAATTGHRFIATEAQ